MKAKLFLLIFVLLILLGISAFFAYHYIYLPKATRLPVPDHIPFFGVWYSYQIAPDSSNNFMFGTEKVSATNLGTKINDDMKKIKESGFGSVKLSFYYKGNNYFSERMALKAAQNDLYPVGILMGHQNKPKDRVFNEEELKEWENFVRDEVRKNKNIIYYWEVWNEPYLNMFWYGPPEDYLILLKRTAKIIREENPDAKIIVSLEAYGKNTREFSEQLLSLGGGDYFDILSFHPYAANPMIREDIFNESVNSIINLRQTYNNKWPLMISEIGQPASEVGTERQAELAEMVLKRAIKEDIPLIWLDYSDQRLKKIDDKEGWGLLDDMGNPKPIYGKFINYITGAGPETS